MDPSRHLAAQPLGSATGRVHHRVDGVATDVADFAFLAPDRWRVRHLSGEEIIAVGGEYWQRANAGAPWRHARDPLASDVHHTGYLRAMLFPERLPALSDARSDVLEDDPAPDGCRRLRVRYVEPEDGTMEVDVTPEGRLRRIAGVESDRTIEIVVDARYDDPPDLGLFDPDTSWSPGI